MFFFLHTLGTLVCDHFSISITLSRLQYNSKNIFCLLLVLMKTAYSSHVVTMQFLRRLHQPDLRASRTFFIFNLKITIVFCVISVGCRLSRLAWRHWRQSSKWNCLPHQPLNWTAVQCCRGYLYALRNGKRYLNILNGCYNSNKCMQDFKRSCHVVQFSSSDLGVTPLLFNEIAST